MRIVKSRQRVEEVSRFVEFVLCGQAFWFPCDTTGQVDLQVLSEGERKCYERCVGSPAAVRTGVLEVRRTDVDPAVGVCDVCGREVLLEDAFANECLCGAEYNGFGQRLAPRKYWGEETGEVF